MNLRALLAISPLVIVLQIATPDAVSAEKLTVKVLGERLAAKPTGPEAEALATDVRAWFGMDRGGRSNLIDGAPPKVEGLETAWAIEAENIKASAVITSDGKTLPLIRIAGTPVFAASVPLADGSAFRFTYVNDGDKKARTGQVEVYTDAPELKPVSGVPKGTLTKRRRGRARSSRGPGATGGCTFRLSTKTASRPVSWSFKMAAATSASFQPCSIT